MHLPQAENPPVAVDRFIDELVRRLTQHTQRKIIPHVSLEVAPNEVSRVEEPLSKGLTAAAQVLFQRMCETGEIVVHQMGDSHNQGDAADTELIAIDFDTYHLCYTNFRATATWRKQPMVFRAWEDHYDKWHLEIYSRQGDPSAAAVFAREFKERLKTENIYRGRRVHFGDEMKFLPPERLTWDDIILPDTIITEVQQQIFTTLDLRDELAKFNVPIRRGILLEGPPGNGKTLLARVVSSLLIGRVTTLWATAQAVEQSYWLNVLFETARYLQPTLIILEDLDLIGGRHRNQGGYRHWLGELLAQLDGLASNENIFVIGTTNDSEMIDAALRNRPARFDRRLRIDKPDQKARFKMFQRLIPNPEELDIDIGELADLTAGFTGAHIREVYNLACIASAHANHQVVLDQDWLRQAITTLRERETAERRIGFVAGEDDDDDE